MSRTLHITLVVIRLILALITIWYFSGAPKKPRFYSGIFTAFLSGVLSYAYLYPLFNLQSIPLASPALYSVVVSAVLVGMALGTLLPFPAPGACMGASIALLIGTSVVPSVRYFPVVGSVLAALGAILSTKSARALALNFASAVIGGGTAASFVFPKLFPYIVNIALGFDHGSSYDHPVTVAVNRRLGLFWLISSCITLYCIMYRNGNLKLSNILNRGSAASAHASNGVAGSTGLQRNNQASATPKKNIIQRNVSPAEPDSFNMYDPADLPLRLAEYANMVYAACEDLGNFFGFQDASVRNQAEHLLILLSNNRRYMTMPAVVQPPSPIHALHSKVFSNYHKWCKSLGVHPNFSRMNAMSVYGPPAVVSRVIDLVLYFCCWGEAGNIRHMPECLWFLYHKMMEEYTKSDTSMHTRSLYAGHYLDKVVTPIYELVNKNMKSNVDHQNKRNYDDFNEFFWSHKCLLYHYYDTKDEDEDVEKAGLLNGPLPGEELSPIIEALTNAPKTFLEKRSWLRGVLALYRIIEWHIVTFYLLSVYAFADELVWGYLYGFQIASGVFLILNGLGIIWGLLEVWSTYPGIDLSVTTICGSVFSLLSRFLIFVYQTLYLMWTFAPTKADYYGLQGDAHFWWWQYIWLSALCMLPYIAQAMMQIYPASTTRVFTSPNDYVQSFLNILFPLSRIYVGKEVHESFKRTAVYAFFWITLIVWKLVFSYIFEVAAMVLPTIELVDDYINYPNQSFAKMSLILLLRWAPQFCVYLIDMSIWYAVWQAFAGVAVGFSESLGDVRDMDDIRNNFVRAPEHFCRKMLSSDAGSRRGSSNSFQSGSNLSNPNLPEGQSLLGSDPHKLQSYVNRLLDVRIQKWVMFSAAWNEIIDHFRQEDIISNEERDNLKFSRFDGFSQAIYLPVFQTAGVFENALSELETSDLLSNGSMITDEEFFQPITSHVTRSTAFSEVWELGSYILLQMLGRVHNDDIVAVMNLALHWTRQASVTDHLKVQQLRSVISNFTALIKILKKGIGSRKPAAKRRQAPTKPNKQAVSKAESKESGSSGGGFRRAVSASSLAITSVEPSSEDGRFNAATNALDLTMKRSKKTTKQTNEVVLDALRDQARDKLRAMMSAIKAMTKDIDAESREVLDRITFLLSMENGFLWNDAYASDQLDLCAKDKMFSKVLAKVYGLVSCHPDDVEPKSKEARRRLTFFVNSLFMDIPEAPTIQDMFSWNVMTPFYAEDVTYTKKDLETRSDALGVSTLLYLQTLYKNDWNNFLERLNIKDEDKIWSKKNYEATRIWASLRSQTLTRTVSGMMFYEKALRLLARLERLDDETTNNLMGEKFGYVVSCQIYGTMKKNQDPKANDIDDLMHKFPHMRIAYIDSIRLNRSGAADFYSVLMKSDRKGGIQEVYRVRLPGNPVLGEGKPENQNHAVIFTRGEFLQTIDMNQEGYFEEALKMRNALQEFKKRDGPLPTTILGLREHIFTGSISSLANYMALQETSFVTLGQRVLTNPLCIRLHYGHPDVFDKLFFMTRGGISKSSKGINLSEDIFAGYNNVVRGGQVAFKEYLQVGKGRDVGMSQIYKFEAKLSQGAAEQSLSRDVNRVSHRLDFFRLLSLYYGGIGHYFSNVLTVFTIYLVTYLMLILAMFDIEKIGDRLITPMGTIQMMLGGLGLLQTVPLFATLGVERGWWNSFREIVMVFVSGGPFHFMFHIQTKAHYMSQTILVGGAKYRATGRGFVTQHTPMDEQFRFFSSSHLYLGFEMAAALIFMGIYTDAGQYFGRTWSIWLASLSFLISPFIFNPLTFELSTVTSDYLTYLRWMRGSTGGPIKSWKMWWKDENSYYSKLAFTSKLVNVAKCALWVLIGEGIRRSAIFTVDLGLYTPWISITKVAIFILAVLLGTVVFRMNARRLPYGIRRTLSLLLIVGLVAAIITVFAEDINFFRYALAAYYYIGAACLIGLMGNVGFVQHFYFIHDLVIGHVIFITLFILGILRLPHHIQSYLLYHNALSTDVVVSDVLRYARKGRDTQNPDEEDDLVEQVAELRKLVQKQEHMLMGAGKSSLQPAESKKATVQTNAVSNLIAASSDDDDFIPTPQPSQGPAKRSLSMSGLDVWGDMALGDVDESGVRSPQLSSYQHGFNPMSMPATDVSEVFTFTQPDTMPPR